MSGPVLHVDKDAHANVFKEGNSINTFVRHQGYTQCV